ncbi:MAG TPA: hypothetical protein VFZ52_02170 [Chryseolinea sp.]
MPADRDYISLYRTLIERKFMLGNGEGKLKQRDIEYLSNLIDEKSRVKLSVSTLKRLWRKDFHQLPHPATLDALVSILDFQDWQDFKKQNSSVITDEGPPQNASPAKRLIRPLPIFIFLGAIVLLIGFFVIQGFNKQNSVIVTKDVLFTADKTITFGVPNTVIFNYDLSGVKADSFFIQQSWNPRDKVSIDPRKNYYSAIYYTPGFHFARLMANDSILKFQKVHIKTDGWMPLVKYDIGDRRQMYLDASAIESNGVMRTTEEILRGANVDVNNDFYLRYYNIRDFDGIDANNFDLETRLKCDKLSLEGTTRRVACPLMEIMLITEENVFFIPVTTKGCVGELELAVGGVYRSGKDSDLSAFGADVYEWQSVRVRNENKKVSIMLNDSVIEEMNYQKDFGKIKGIIYTFTGPGSVDFLRFKNTNGDLIYGDEFGQDNL